MPFSRIRPPSELASGVSNATTTGLSFGSNWNVTCAIQAVAIEPPRLGASKRPDTASIAPARDSVALLFHRSRIIQASSGTSRIFRHLRDFTQRGGISSIYVGLGNGVTSRQAATHLLDAGASV